MTADPYKWRRRLGRFVLTQHFREDWEQGVRLIQSKILIRELTTDWSTGNAHYSAQGSMFDILDEGEVIPLYTVIVWQRITSAGFYRPVTVEWRRAVGPLDQIEYRTADFMRDDVALSSTTHPGMNADFSGPEGTPTDLERAKSVSEILQVLDQVWYQHDDPQVEAAFKRVCVAKETYYRA